MALVADSLPSALGSRLDEAGLRQLAETPRAGRLEVLARLLGLTEEKALAELAAATGLDVVTSPRAAEAELGLLPARLAHDFQAVPLAVAGASPDELALATSWPPGPDLAAWIAT